jgi:hypothetical protein
LDSNDIENLLWVIDLYQLIELASKRTSCAELGFRNSPIPPEDDLVLQVQGVIIADERARSRSLAGAVVAAPVEDFVTAAHRGRFLRLSLSEPAARRDDLPALWECLLRKDRHHSRKCEQFALFSLYRRYSI